MRKRSILFVLGRWTVGGVERVTLTVANALTKRGWMVGIVVFEVVDDSLLKQLDGRIVVKVLKFPAWSISNFWRIRKTMKQLGTSYVINQWSNPFPMTVLLKLAARRNVRFVAFNHTMPSRNKRVTESAGIKKCLFRLVFRLNLCLVYHFNDAYVLLSGKFVELFARLIGLRSLPKVRVIPNPLPEIKTGKVKKENLILYVGRLDCVEKRIDRVIDVWRNVSPKLADWKLEIVGDGPDRLRLERRAIGMQRISFKGFQDPGPYFSRAKILLLTSDFEGFGLVLVEAQSAGCVPISFASFPSVTDIINGHNGVAVPIPWDVDRFSAEVLKVANDECLRDRMAKEGLLSVKRFSVDSVVDRYEVLLAELE